MYKILILRRSGDTLYSPLMETKDEDGKMVESEFTADTLEALESKIIELLETMPKANIRAVQDMTFTIDLLID